MKKRIANLCLLLLCAATAAVAQTDGTFQFVDKSGNAVADGSTITVSELTEDEFLGNYINSGLFVKNTSGEAAVARVVYTISQIDNGSLQVCFPVTCNSKADAGTYETSSGTLQAGERHDLESEWFPTAYGTCQATYRLEVMQQMGVFPNYSYVKTADGPTVTVLFSNPDPANVKGVTYEADAPVAVYDAQGRPVVAKEHHGLLIERRADDSVRKRMAK